MTGQLRDLLAAFPRETTVGEILDQLDRMAPREEAECAYCEKQITRDGTSPWVHRDGSRGCRAATFDESREGSCWDNSIPKSWTAKPA